VLFRSPIKLIKKPIQNSLINYLLYVAFRLSKEDANQYQNGNEALARLASWVKLR
jgi:hypothetical protein